MSMRLGSNPLKLPGSLVTGSRDAHALARKRRLHRAVAPLDTARIHRRVQGLRGIDCRT